MKAQAESPTRGNCTDEKGTKRKRARESVVEQEAATATHDGDSHRRPIRSKHKHTNNTTKKPLTGIVLAVSAASNKNSVQTYKSIQDLCHQAGATTSNQVHKRVFAVVATDAAGSTQRVRQARKRNIQVVTLQWVRDCVAHNVKLPIHDEYVYRQSDNEPFLHHRATTVTSVTVARSTKALPTLDGDRAATLSTVHTTTIDLGCCCACHETNEPVDCSWCMDCSVARAAVKAARICNAFG
jgi:hypothetical protein